MIRHCVMLRLGEGNEAHAEQVLEELGDLVAQLEGCHGFCAGPNLDFERKSQEYPYGFTLDADDAIALAVYAGHPEHKKLGGQLVALCEGGADGILVFDLEVQS